MTEEGSVFGASENVTICSKYIPVGEGGGVTQKSKAPTPALYFQCVDKRLRITKTRGQLS